MRHYGYPGVRRAWRLAVALTLVFSANLSNPPAGWAAVDTIPSDILDPYSVGWNSARDLTSAQAGPHIAEMRRLGYMLIDVEIDEIDGVERIGTVWQKNLEERDWAEWHNMTAAQFVDIGTDLGNAGFRLIDQEAYVVGGQQRYGAVWIENIENLAWVSYHDVTSAQFAENFGRYEQQGMMPIDIEAYLLAGELRYSAVWVDNTEGLDWRMWRDMTEAEFGAKYGELLQDFRMIDFESYFVGGQQYFAGIWVENPSQRAYAVWYGMSSKGFGDRWLQLRDEGYRLINYEVYPTASGWRYAAVWRQNSIRPAWPHKNAITAGVEDYIEGNDGIPGLSVAIYHNGQFVYLRGFGFADVDDEIIAHSGTIYRTASVAKAVSGVFALRLDQLTLVNLNELTSSYIPGLPAAHNHMLWQTITNRSGIGHYDIHPSLTDQYDTDLAAAQDLWDVPPFYTPGSVYSYTTHAYTYMGAALEGALGSPSEQIYDTYMRNPFDLNTLRPEDRSVPHPFRATIYNTANEEVAADNLSWKRWGGGLESSAFDLARLGVHLLDNTILDEAATNRLWTPPDALDNYAYGWDTGTQFGGPVVGKAGFQNGARSYIRIYPDEDLVIVVMSNRRGHDTRQLCIDIANYILTSFSNQAATALPAGILPAQIEEPEAEFQDPAQVLFPQHTPVATPSPEDLREDDVGGINGFALYLPLIKR
jgi:CubicO group peptidase (beta-lactamase class C family)